MAEQTENAPQPVQEESKGQRAAYFDEGEVERVIEEVPVTKLGNPTFGGAGRVRISKIYENHEPFMNKIITVAGWARNCRRGGKDLMFIDLNDGSCMGDLQVVMDAAVPGFESIYNAQLGASFKLRGTLIRSPKEGQEFELQLSQADKHEGIMYGNCPSKDYPFAGKKTHSMEHLRQHAHLRARTKLMSAIFRVRNSLAFATHAFFQGRGCNYVHSPIITCSDCEGAGEMFQVTTMLPEVGKTLGHQKGVIDPYVALAAKKAEEEKAAAKAAEEAKKEEGKEEEKKEEEKKEGEPMSKAQLKKLAKQKEAEAKKAQKAAAGMSEEQKKAEAEKQKKEEEEKKIAQEEAEKAEKGEIEWKDYRLDYQKDFFSKPAFLTVSGQLGAENFACSMGDVYTFGPTFRAENSHTSRHLAEFWMIEPELSFINFEELKDCAEAYLKYCLKFALENCRQDIEYLQEFEIKNVKDKKSAPKDGDLIARLEQVISTPFKRLPYTEAIEVLQAEEAKHEGKKPLFEVKVEWGIDLGSEHERYLVEKVFKIPVILTDYPKDIKAFYMRMNDDERTVQAMDVLAPAIGEIIGGSMREERLEVLDRMLQEKGLPVEQYDWYRELRSFGTIPHGGFGLGFERLVMMATGVENIRDVIPFPRYPGNAAF